MLRGVFAALTAAVFVCVLLVAVASLRQFPDAVARKHRRPSPISVATKPRGVNNALREQSKLRTRRHASAATDSILFPDWEILVIAPSVGDPGDGEHLCLFENNAKAPARPAWVLQPGNRSTFICVIPASVRRRRSILQPALIGSSSQARFPEPERRRPLTRWKFLAYESFSTADDVVVFAKGVNRRQGTNRSPSELNCVFLLGGDVAAKTAVTVSAQEVFRCAHPPALAVPNGDEDARIKVSIEIVPDGNLVVPTAAHYVPARRSPAIQEDKALLCACTMVYRVAKFLREWVTYHSGIGIERFVLYDNGSDDGLEKTVQSLREGGFDVATVLWPWPKTQEAGFSHCALHARDSCTWMAYIDVDEFIFAESSLNSSLPSKQTLRSLLPPSGAAAVTNQSTPPIGEVTIGCREFGPSEQRAHPPGGVMQGYTCRRRMEERHKSMVRLDAVHESLLNSIHHFKVKQGFRQEGLSTGKAVVNHYKYQAWPEFKAKFRRRVSAYVVDWRQAVNLASKDRTPGLGFEAVEPKDWAKMFCEVRDERLKKVAERWYGTGTGTGTDSGLRMAWQT